MKVLFIGKRFYTNRDALRERFGRIYQLPRVWAESGIATELWLVDYHSKEYVQMRDEALAIESTRALGMPFLKRLFAQAFSRTQRFDVVVASGDPYVGLLGHLLARRCKARFVFDVYDKYDEFESYRRLGGFDPFRYLLDRADVRLFASKALLDSLGRPNSEDFLVPNGVDENRFRPLDMKESRHSLDLPQDAQFIGYFGSMEPARGVDDLIESVEMLRRNGSAVQLLIGGRKRDDLDLSRPGIRYVGNALFERVPALIASCNAVAIPYRRTPFMDAGASNKIAEAMACGKPLVVTDTPNFCVNFAEQAERLSDRIAGCGDSMDIARVIEAQMKDPVIVTMPTNMSWRSIAKMTAMRLKLAAGGPEL